MLLGVLHFHFSYKTKLMVASKSELQNFSIRLQLIGQFFVFTEVVLVILSFAVNKIVGICSAIRAGCHRG